MKRLFPMCFSLIISAFVLCGVAYAAGIRINTTPSIPVGVYRITDDLVIKGEYVVFCSPLAPVFEMARDRGYIGAGYCPGGYGHLMKKISASQGDVVTISADGVKVNGLLLPLSAQAVEDGAGRPLTKYEASWVLGKDEFLLMADDNGGSFDGRYFGAVDRSQIEGVIRPVFTW